ncbi:serine protease inhibitor ecotin [Brucella intermedia]|uniref:Ecotin n=4 Tax=Brucella/Ochrobactrum group TaxID=2826938 RepID=C4WFX0_9HYPH|nr:Ecotin precursor [Brucella intermedia LMG 3301]ELT48756.1 proteinase inhibitor I11 ecotin [Brucella intermedia M86]KAB2714203.1 serine protease inhibitor ecotin [Brucella intermedia]NKC28440.1 serine protease inhibitor ecotin [Brucella ciceri]PJT23486.1 ecotin [Ochrobactrum sp. 30A/1000/2015]PJT37993.1 ecotin [Ochrobactrum sp. 27A/999/2015]PJT41526.1 ecotin [Ochrobactrum sp. 23A/997/2015]
MTMKARQFLQIGLIAASFAVPQVASAEGKTESERNLQAFPAAPSGSYRYVIHLPPLEKEQDAKVEIIAGRNATVDCNISWFGGSLTPSTVEGWGFDYFTLTASDRMSGTLMACPEDSKRTDFVPVRGENFMLRYNSRLPIVIYAKDGFEIRYRIWKPSEETHNAERG